MNRREIVFCPIAAFSSMLPSPAFSRISCGVFVPPGVQQCEVGIDGNIASIAAASVGGQHLSQWCWAACIEMIFNYYGFDVPQERVVQDAWGAVVNLPGQPQQILASLNRTWTDENGRNFAVAGDVLSANPITAAQDLSQDMPLIIGTMGHAMVLSSLVYVRDQFGNGEVLNAIVRDPWPNRGRRSMSQQEWFSTNFLARIRVW